MCGVEPNHGRGLAFHPGQVVRPQGRAVGAPHGEGRGRWRENPQTGLEKLFLRAADHLPSRGAEGCMAASCLTTQVFPRTFSICYRICHRN